MPSRIPRERSLTCLSPAGLHRVAYVEWGEADNPRVLVCAHGLARVGRDFDDLARSLCDRYRVVCPDIVGRGRSAWLTDPAHYQVPQYVSDMVTLIARLDVETVHWVGTSMGGLIGMGLASLPDSPVRALVLNDVGPTIKAAALARIAEYLGRAPVFPDLASAEGYIRFVSAPFRLSTDAQWRHLTETSLRPVDGGYTLHYDPAIAKPLAAQGALAGDIDIWPIYEAIRCPTLAVRGELSDLLDRDTHQAMAERGPRAHLAEIPGVGHAPMLMDASQIDVVRDFLINLP
jgi:pimeloyl-ACP methyl ester carboxylesterase